MPTRQPPSTICLLSLSVYKSFDEITSDKTTSDKLQAVYKDINTIDLWVGGLAEDHVEDAEVGETFHKILVDQFTRLRDGDRFWYRNQFNDKVRVLWRPCWHTTVY